MYTLTIFLPDLALITSIVAVFPIWATLAVVRMVFKVIK